MKKFNINTNKYNFHELVAEVFEVDDLSQLHKLRDDLLPDEVLNLYTESSTKFHDTFYTKLNDNWIELYELYDNFIHTEIVKVVNEPFHYQKWPSFRVHIPSDQAIHTWHCDGDPLHKHPPGEINFFLPLTKCYGTNTIWVESEPWKLDFSPLETEYGQYWMFNGNQCLHGNKPNKTNLTRVSFDFRAMNYSDYQEHERQGKQSIHAKVNMVIGEYYEVM